MNALEARGFAARSEFKKGWRWDITEQGRHQVEAWQQ